MTGISIAHMLGLDQICVDLLTTGPIEGDLDTLDESAVPGAAKVLQGFYVCGEDNRQFLLRIMRLGGAIYSSDVGRLSQQVDEELVKDGIIKEIHACMAIPLSELRHGKSFAGEPNKIQLAGNPQAGYVVTAEFVAALRYEGD